MSEHTPAPWKVELTDIGDEEFILVPGEVVGADGFKVISAEGGEANKKTS